MRILQANTRRPLDLLSVSSGGLVATASSNFNVRGEVDVWNAATGAFVYHHLGAFAERPATGLAFEPDGHLLVGIDQTIVRIDPATRVAASGPPLSLSFPEFALSRDGTRLLVAVSRNEYAGLECFAVGPGPGFRKLWSEGLYPYVRYADPAVSPDGSRVAAAEHLGSATHPGNAVQLRDGDTGKVFAEVTFPPAEPLEEIVFSADGAKLLARSSGRTVKAFDAATGQPAGELVHPGRPYVTGMAVHPNGTVACGRTNGTVCLWNLERGELVRTLDWKAGKLVSVAFSPDGTVGAAGTEDGQVIVWDVD